MKFQTKTEMMTAHWKDVEMAVAQGTISSIPFPGVKNEFHFAAEAGWNSSRTQGAGRFSFATAWLMLIVSMTLFGASWCRLRSVKQEAVATMEPLMPSEKGVSA